MSQTTQISSLDFPAADGRPVSEAHAQHCYQHGHATHRSDGTDTGTCPRCGDATTPAAAAAESAKTQARITGSVQATYDDGRGNRVTAMRLEVWGPNLPSRDEAIHVHLAGCADTKRGFYRTAERPEIDLFTTQREVVEMVYPADNFDYDADTEWPSFASDVKFFPCCADLALGDIGTAAPAGPSREDLEAERTALTAQLATTAARLAEIAAQLA